MMRPITLCAALGLATSVAGQSVIWSVTGRGQEILVYPSAIKDLSGDGVDDVLVAVGVNSSSPQRLWLLSGTDGSLLRVAGPDLVRQYLYQWVDSAGDWDGDGVQDYVVSIQRFQLESNLVEVRSGRDDRVLWSVSGPSRWLFGSGLIGNMNLDGDGRPDLIIAAPTTLPTLRAYSNGGTLLWTTSGQAGVQVGFRGNRALRKLGDLNGDGFDDFVDTYNQSGFNGAVVLSGRDASILVLGAVAPTEGFGVSNDVCGDVDGDGVLDFGSGRDGFGATIWSGVTGQQLWRWFPPLVNNKFGWDVSSKGLDVDRDGVPDFAVGDPDISTTGARGGFVQVFSGRDASSIVSFDRNLLGQSGTVGRMLELQPPADGNPYPRLLSFGNLGFMAACPQPSDCGRIAMIRLASMGVVPFGSACRGALTKTPQIGLRGLGSATRVHMSGAEPGGLAVLVLGFSNTSWRGVALPAALPGLPGCQLLVSGDVVVPVIASTGPLGGYASVDLPVPLAVAGSVAVYGQWVAIASGPGLAGGASDGLAWTH